jgi:hypothetical protein
MKIAVSALASAVLFAALSPQASAIERLELTNATGLCQGALPNFETNLRKRPSGVLNISTTTNAFVSCSTTQNFFLTETGSAAVLLGALLTNATAAPVNVSCTMVTGLNYLGFESPTQYPKTFTVPANSSIEGVWSTEDDNGGEPFPASLNLSCNLPAGIEIGSVYWYNPDDGTAPTAPPPV